ncbi:hypothetical protein PRVXH_001811 [Proteinivorax hydrogeniformans]|uniref:Uncharacterized protein n=1 Tax=Proteinivorax hydrogeniformans TaxID=1826727 RepID=A0AAU8HSA7_9FIRM
MDYLNIFIPYKNKPLHHEDQLTRAFLILIKTVKLVEVLFLEVVIDEMQKNQTNLIPKGLMHQSGGLDTIETQVRSTTKGRLEGEKGRLVSIVITDERLDREHKVERTDREGVYDGFIKYKPDWVFVIENKPDHKNIWLEQLNSRFNENYEIEEKPIVLTWKEIITKLSLLIENNLINNADLSIVSDFLDYVSEFFPELNPYDRFELCKDNKYLLDRRCIEIMKETELGVVDYHRGWHHYIHLDNKPGVKEVAVHASVLENNGWSINLLIYPGDTMSQSRDFYSTLSVDKVLDLANKWEVLPNFHFAFRSSNLLWTSVSASLYSYLTFWKNEVLNNNLKQRNRTDWGEYFNLLEKNKMLNDNDLTAINEKIIKTKMQKLNICPGVAFKYTWSKEEAIGIDNKSPGAFKSELLRRIKEVLSTW